MIHLEKSIVFCYNDKKQAKMQKEIIMLSYYRDFVCHYYAPSHPAYAPLLEAGEVILTRFGGEMEEMVEQMYQNNCNIYLSKDQRKDLANRSGVNFYTLNYIFLVCASRKAKAMYQEKGYSETLFYDTFEDLDYKLQECYAMHGVYGNFVEWWYAIFYRLKCFKLGRLEFEPVTYHPDTPYTKDGLTIEKGDTVLSVHIPASGPMTTESRLDSYRRAYEFFPECIYDGKLVMICDSWLLYRGNREMFPPELNIHQFTLDWDIIISNEDPHFRDCWRLFYTNYQGDPSALPYDNRARRAVVDWLKAGKHCGTGYGIAFFDGEKLLTNN